MRICFPALFALTFQLLASHAAAVETLPLSVQLHGADSQQQLVVSARADGRDVDLTRLAKYTSGNEAVAKVSAAGIVTPVGDGETQIRIQTQHGETTVLVTVSQAGQTRALDFENDIIPVLTDGGCNSGPCHGKARGQGGFKLSLFGFDPEYDFGALSRESRGRRIFPTSPERSLLLRKPIGDVPHGGGLRLEKGDAGYTVLLRWIQDGMPRRADDAPKLVNVTVAPVDRILNFESQQQLIVTAHYSDGSTRDVTSFTAYQSNEGAIAGVNEDGLVETTNVTGEAAIMARYLGRIAVATISVPLAAEVPDSVYADLPRTNFIDDLVWKKLQRLRLTPSQPAPDSEFLRRVYVDIIGRVPTVEEARTFLKDESPAKRTRLVDELLDNPEYVDHWSNKWADLLRPNPYRAGIKSTLSFDNWIREAFRRNKPYDEFVRELLTARGSTFRNGAVVLFRDRREPEELTTIVSQLFLGIRLECAKCHQHPNEAWGQKEFYGLAAYFDRLGRKGTGISAPISGSEEYLFVGKRRPVKHPLTGEEMSPTPLTGEPPVIADEEDPRESLAAWITSDGNPLFRQVIANRIWKDIMSRGLVEPVDDLRASNPATNPELLEALAVDLRDNGYDLKHLIRRIANSYVYSLSSMPSDTNVVDSRNYSRFYRERLRAEVLLDSVSQITGIEEKFDAMPPGSTARQLWSHRIDSLFLDAFGRPDPNQDPPCERFPDTTIVQALHLMNSQSLYDKVTSDKGLAASLSASDKSTEAIIEDLYLAAFARFPTDPERQAATEFLASQKDTRRTAVQDLLWAMLNTPEFVFKH
ncbi:DUF1553 domain-containing protein [bacterium]|nr:DUF1553 domain-containing protein [bacterium]